MTHNTTKPHTAFAAILSLALCAMFAATQPALAQNTVAVVVNGSQMQFEQPPVERAGRVFVPLRGVFERLGATVVYDNGTINATGSGRNVSLHIGSTQATVNGQTQTLDVAPFIVGSSTLVPLRFIAQALGATVDWNNSNSTVTITGGSGNQNGNYDNNNNNYGNQQPQAFYLTNETPTHAVNTQNPAIHATYSEPVRRGTMRVAIDGRDVTNDVYSNAAGFDVTPSFALGAGRHRVTVTGTTQAGQAFSSGWSFQTNGASTSGVNFIRRVQPATGASVGPNFNLSGRTLPGSQVHIVATGETSALGGLIQLGTGTYQSTVQADQNGNFNVTVAIGNGVRGSQVRVVVQSIAPDGSSSEGSYTYVM